MTGAGFLPLWTATMAAMMLPSTVPLLRLDYATSRSWARVVVLGAGYLSVWIAFGCAVLAVDVLAGDRLLGMHGRRATAAFLAVAALYQLLPVKRRCLTRCRAPLSRLLLGWREGVGGAVRMGVSNGFWCAGCCAGLMAALLGLGLMSWMWMSVVGATILLEKLTSVSTVPVSAVLAAGAVAWAL